MADQEFHQGGVCGGSWWNSSSRNLFGPCSLASNVVNPWQTSPDHLLSSEDRDSAGSASDGGVGGGGCSVLLQNVQTNSSWMNQDLLRDGGTSVENYSDILQEPAAAAAAALDSGMNYISAHHHQSLPNSSAAFPANSSLFQTLFDSDQPQHSLLHNQTMNYPNYGPNSGEFLPGLPDQIPPPSMFAKQQLTNHLPIWSSAPAANSNDSRGNFLPTTQPQFLPSAVERHNFPSLNTKRQNEAARPGSTVAKKAGNEPTPKHPRIETPSPLPTFKVRKEKLGDRITALQQLVSPFGKTDTASVLHEAIDYIKYLHDQLNALCTPYLKNGSPQGPLQCQQASDNNLNDEQGHGQDLRSGGLCLVPISSTFPVADASTDFWSPSFMGTFKL